MEMNENPVKEVLGELFTLLEGLEAQSSAVLEFVKEQGGKTEAEWGPYLERAGNASSVKWRAARLRMEYLLSPTAEKPKEKEGEKREPEQAASEEQGAEKEAAKNGEGHSQEGAKAASASGGPQEAPKHEAKEQ